MTVGKSTVGERFAAVIARPRSFPACICERVPISEPNPNCTSPDSIAGITAAVLGVIASLGLWFGIHVLFGEVRTERSGILRLTAPVLQSFDPQVLVLAAVCAVLFVRFRWSVHRVLAVSALLALGIWAVR